MGREGKMHIYTGDGKGKTTAAEGLAVRFCGNGGKVMFVQFLKTADSSELSSFEELGGVTMMPNPWNWGFTWDMSDADKEEARGIYSQYLDMIGMRFLQGNFGMLVMDEVIGAVNAGLVDEQELFGLFDQLPDEAEIVLTGRDPSQALVDRADYVTEMRKVKHPFDQGLHARKGIEY